VIVLYDTRAQFDMKTLNITICNIPYTIIIHINYLFILCINNVINMMYFKLSDLLLLTVVRSAIICRMHVKIENSWIKCRA